MVRDDEKWNRQTEGHSDSSHAVQRKSASMPCGALTVVHKQWHIESDRRTICSMTQTNGHHLLMTIVQRSWSSSLKSISGEEQNEISRVFFCFMFKWSAEEEIDRSMLERLCSIYWSKFLSSSSSSSSLFLSRVLLFFLQRKFITSRGHWLTVRPLSFPPFSCNHESWVVRFICSRFRTSI